MIQSPVILEGAGLRLTFVPHGDRLAHTIGLVEAGRYVPLLASVEGTDDEPWPASPPLTTLQLESRAETRIAMLLGMAGRSHWSASVEFDAARRCVRFEVACRVAEPPPPETLRSSYRSMIEPQAAADGSIALAIDGLAARVTLDRDSPPEIATASHRKSSAAVQQSDSTRLEITDEGLCITVDPAEGLLPRTVRWGYCVSRVG